MKKYVDCLISWFPAFIYHDMHSYLCSYIWHWSTLNLYIYSLFYNALEHHMTAIVIVILQECNVYILTKNQH